MSDSMPDVHGMSLLASVDRFIFVSNHLPIRCNKSADGSTWDFAWDDDALIAQAKVGIPDCKRSNR